MDMVVSVIMVVVFGIAVVCISAALFSGHSPK
jgi:hypothetical protein